MLMMENVALANQRVLIREDFNVPLQDGKVAHAARIDAALPTIKQAIAAQAKVILMSHLGRPVAGQFDQAFSLAPIAAYLSKALNQEVALVDVAHLPPLQKGQVVLLENVRFLEGEEENAPALSQQLAALCDVFVMDAFAVSHRKQASTYGVAEYAPIACAGPLLQKELSVIDKVLKNPKKPVLAIVGGAKVSGKLDLLTSLLEKVDVLVVGGGIANTFLAATGKPVGASLYEETLVPTAQKLLEQAKKQGKKIWLPTDVVVAHDLAETAIGQNKTIDEVQPGDKIFDIGVASQKDLAKEITKANTILWNGPVGVFEMTPFSAGTRALAQAIAQSEAYSVAGGGDTLAAISAFDVEAELSYLSTGGGAFLEMCEGKVLPAVSILMTKENKRAK